MLAVRYSLKYSIDKLVCTIQLSKEWFVAQDDHSSPPFLFDKYDAGIALS